MSASDAYFEVEPHPAAVRAAEEISSSVGGWGPRKMHSTERLISSAIDDHLKSEGWEELKEAAVETILDASVTGEMVRLRMALRRV